MTTATPQTPERCDQAAVSVPAGQATSKPCRARLPFLLPHP